MADLECRGQGSGRILLEQANCRLLPGLQVLPMSLKSADGVLALALQQVGSGNHLFHRLY